MPLLLAKILGSLSVVLVAFIGGWVVHGWKVDSEYKAQYQSALTQLAKQQASIKALSDAYNVQQNKYFSSINKIRDQAHAEIQKPIYTTCVVPASGMQLINAAIAETNTIKSTS